MKPLVSIVCLCYNHEKFVTEALNSVLSQTYESIEVIVMDDCSTDKSRELIVEVTAGYPHVKRIDNEINIGNCKSFNRALSICKGKYVVDFATDDIMFPDRIRKQVEVFEKLGDTYGVIFTNAMNIDEQGKETGLHFKDSDKVPSGEVYARLLEEYFINPPTMMIRKATLEELGGYDERLEYEDFDFWVRSSRNCKYYYLGEVLTKRRKSSFSHSSKFYKKGFMKMGESTYRVIQKAMWLNKSKEENRALTIRINSELRQAFYIGNFELVSKYYSLLKELNANNYLSGFINILSRLKIPVISLYQVYLKIRD